MRSSSLKFVEAASSPCRKAGGLLLAAGIACLSSSASSVGHRPLGGQALTAALPANVRPDLALQTIQLAATSSDGLNTNTARLGMPVGLSTTITGGPYLARGWKLVGAGNLVGGGVNGQSATYMPPQSMPANPTVQIIAYLYGNTAVRTTYTFSLLNPVPAINSSNGVAPYQLLTGATQPVSITGSGFVPGTVALLNGSSLATGFVDYSHLVVQVPVAANATGSITMQLSNPAPGGGAGTIFIVAVLPNAISLTANGADGANTGLAALGATVNMNATVTGSANTAVSWSVLGAGTLSNSGVYTAPSSMPGNASVTIQASLVSNPAITASYALQLVSAVTPAAAARLLDQTSFGPTTALIQHVQQTGMNGWLTEQFNAPPTALQRIPDAFPSYCGSAEMCLESEWYTAALTGNDQLRQRVALALSEMFVVSSNVLTGQGINAYANLLANDAFTNWYQIMTDVTLSPAMGIYLNMVGSYRPMAGQIANENYARENLQLFNLGLNLINQDGTPQVDSSGNLLPAYSEAQIQAFARAYTGWTYANPDGSTPSQFIGLANYYHPMVPVQQWHDQTQKTLMNGTVLPGGQTAEADLAGALTNIFNHPNVPPFVCKQLIQHLVTSNPSPGYVSRVAGVFTDNGSGVRGDMKAVLSAILTDPEARAGDTAAAPSDGHLREPVLWVTGVMRGLGYTNIDPNNYYQYLSNYTGVLGEIIYQAPSVFNFFPPNYVVPGTTLNAPEFALENTASVTDRLTVADQLVHNQINGFNVDLSVTSPLGSVAANPGNLVDALGTIFLHSRMDPNARAAVIADISGIPNLPQRVRTAAYLVVTSNDYKILH